MELNSLQESVTVLPLSWGLVTSSYFTLVNCLDFVIGSDLFFDPEVFEPLLVTVRWLLDNNPGGGGAEEETFFHCGSFFRVQVSVHGPGAKRRLVHRGAAAKVGSRLQLRAPGDLSQGHRDQRV